MTIQQAIDAARVLRGTEITDEMLAAWLSSMDENLWYRVLRNYGVEKLSALPYYTDSTEAGDQDWRGIELMLEERYAINLYPLWLVMQIDLHHADYERYNNDAMLYNAQEGEWKRDVSRNHQWRPPKPEGWPNVMPWGGNINIRF